MDDDAAPVGKVAELWRHPVKSLQGEPLAEAVVSRAGVAGDRAWAVVDPATGEALSAKREPRLLDASARTEAAEVLVTLPDGTTAPAGDPGLDAAVSAWLGRRLELRAADTARPTTFAMHVAADDDTSPLVRHPNPAGTFFDLAPLHLLSTASLAAMVPYHPTGRWEVARFRPTILVAVDGSGFVEDGWVGATLTMGDVRARVVLPTARCAMPTRRQPGLPRDLGILQALDAHHDANLGVYAWVTTPGRLAVGVPVTRS